MKLALVRAKYDPFGGAERFVENAATALAGAGLDLTIVTREWPTQANAQRQHVVLNPRYYTKTGRERTFADAVRAHIANARYDLVQSHERIVGCDVYRAGDGVHAAWLAHRSRVQSAGKQWWSSLSPHHRYVLATERAMFESTALKAVVCNSALVKREITERFNIESHKLRVLYSGVDSEKFHPRNADEWREPTRKRLGIPKSAPVALFVGSGFERKGLAGFLMAVAECADPSGAGRGTRKGWHAIVVGKDKHLARFQSFADGLGLTGRCVFVGGVDDVRPYYAAANVMLLPTLYDPFPNACLEAMACGLPTITSTTSGAAELIHDADEGFVTDALDVPAMARALEACVQDSAMPERARARVLPLTPAAMAAQYLALYRELLALPETSPADASRP